MTVAVRIIAIVACLTLSGACTNALESEKHMPRGVKCDGRSLTEMANAKAAERPEETAFVSVLPGPGSDHDKRSKSTEKLPPGVMPPLEIDQGLGVRVSLGERDLVGSLPRNPDAASVKCWADAGDPIAQYVLGRSLMEGRRSAISLKEALLRLNEAASPDDEEVCRDVEKAGNLCSGSFLSARYDCVCGLPEAQFELARLLEARGDRGAANLYYERAAASGVKTSPGPLPAKYRSISKIAKVGS